MEDLYLEIRRQGSGVWARSSATTFIIFCVGQDIRKRAAFISWARASLIRFKPLVGMYRGQSEHSFIASTEHYEKLLPWFKDEETVLHLTQPDGSGNFRATLHYLATDMRVDLGRLYNVERKVALASENWTYDPVFNCYFICRK